MSEIKTKTNAKGLPGKSYTYILTLDMYINMLLSILSTTPFFDYYCASYIYRKHRYKDRLKTVVGYLKYTAVADESRTLSLVENNVLRRTDVMHIAENMHNSSKKVEKILDTDNPSIDDLRYLCNFRLKIGDKSDLVIRNINDIHKKMTKFKKNITNHYLLFVLKKLMERRKKSANKESLKTDAYYVILEMINNYNPKRSKVPFNNFLLYFTRNQKNTVIKRQQWGLPEGSLVSIEQSEDNTLMKEVEKELKKDTSNEKLQLIEEIVDQIPFPLKKVLELNYNLVNPLSVEEEITILLNN